MWIEFDWVGSNVPPTPTFTNGGAYLARVVVPHTPVARAGVPTFDNFTQNTGAINPPPFVTMGEGGTLEPTKSNSIFCNDQFDVEPNTP